MSCVSGRKNEIETSQPFFPPCSLLFEGIPLGEMLCGVHQAIDFAGVHALLTGHLFFPNNNSNKKKSMFTLDM